MAKKVRKPRSANPRTYSQAGPQPADAAPPSKSASTAQPVRRPASPTAAAEAPVRSSKKSVDLRAEYPFVGKDLKRLGFTAGVMFGVLVLLNVVLNLAR